ncbi:hypothetical protein AB0Y20_01395 [Heyndrickxia oleronia]|uniref:hypothetical protein n=1 Tax=Heyndrickxia oleronia TaxID=38875 RepID=UPI003F2688CB
MSYSSEEQEININKERLSDKFHIYTNDSTWLTKLLKIAEPIDPEFENGRIISAKFELQANQVSLRKPSKKREMTDEQRKAAAERLRKARENK